MKIVTLLIITYILFSVFTNNSSNSKPTKSVEQLLTESIVELNKLAGTMINSDTRLDFVTSNGRTLTYTYTLFNEVQPVQNYINYYTKQFCTDSRYALYREKNVSVKRVFRDSKVSILFTLSNSNKNC